ncbi:MAG: hypothetical protein QOF01_4388 [Thermomicrobiales bacterium]|nr:hypothetical protein [Thermomicrobiales bacterium]
MNRGERPSAPTALGRSRGMLSLVYLSSAVSVMYWLISVAHRSTVSPPAVLAQTVTAQQQITIAPTMPSRIQSHVRRFRGGGGSGGRLDIRQSGEVGGSSQGCRVSTGGGTTAGGGGGAEGGSVD